MVMKAVVIVKIGTIYLSFKTAAFIIQFYKRICWHVLHRVLVMTHFQAAPFMRITGCSEARCIGQFDIS